MDQDMLKLKNIRQYFEYQYPSQPRDAVKYVMSFNLSYILVHL